MAQPQTTSLLSVTKDASLFLIIILDRPELEKKNQLQTSTHKDHCFYTFLHAFITIELNSVIDISVKMKQKLIVDVNHVSAHLETPAYQFEMFFIENIGLCLVSPLL